MPRDFQREEFAAVPAGWHVRTIVHNPDRHLVRIAFPPGRRKRGAGRLVSILHPKGENPRACRHLVRRRQNPEALTATYAVEPGNDGQFYVQVLDEGQPIGYLADEHGEALGWAKKKAAEEVAADLGLGSARNPDDPDSRALADFRGRSPKETLKFQEAQLKRPTDMWAIGDLTGLWLSPVKGSEYTKGKWGKATIAWKQEEGVKLAADQHEASRQLYIVCGTPKARLLPEDFIEGCQPESYDAAAEFAALGPVYGIEYITEKRMDKFIPTAYGHQFGEETGEVPYLWYHRPTQSLILQGGAYRIEGKDRELGNSPGIAN